LIAPKGAGEM